MNAKTSVFFICVEAIIYLLLNNLRNCTFKVSETIGRQNHYETNSFKNHTIQDPMKICSFKNILFYQCCLALLTLP